MWKSYLAAALRNLSRNKLHSAITTLSLAIGFTGLILASLFWHYEHSYDRFWPNAERISMIVEWAHMPPAPAPPKPEGMEGVVFPPRPLITPMDVTEPDVAAHIRQETPEAEEVTRMLAATVKLGHGEVKEEERNIQWADPNLFSVLRPKVVAGDLEGALKAANSIVLTRSLARKYFGEADPLGQVMTLAPRDETVTDEKDAYREPIAVQVTAVIEDMPVDTHLVAPAFVSGLTSGSPLEAASTTDGSPEQLYYGGTHTYVLMRSAADRPALQRRLNDLARRHYALGAGRESRAEFKVLPIEQAYFKPAGYYPPGNWILPEGALKRGGQPGLLLTINIFAGLMMAVAAINFVTLMTARGARRAVEVGIRKAVGARRRDLVAQFIGEAALYAGLAFVLGLAGAELAVPAIDTTFGLVMGFDYRHDAGLVGLLLAAALGLGAAAGLYPALALSAFRPASVLKGGPMALPGSARLRQALIAIQFIPLITLGLFTLTQDRQTHAQAAAQLALFDPEALLIDEACTPALKAGIAALPGVAGIACMPVTGLMSDGRLTYLTVGGDSGNLIKDTNGKRISFSQGVDYGAIEFNGMRTLAGATFSPDRPADDEGVVINDTARRALGLASADAAMGQPVTRVTELTSRPFKVVGVVSDRGKSGDLPEFYVFNPVAAGDGVGVKLAPADRAATLAAMDRLWAAAGKPGPMKRQTYADFVRERYSGQYGLARTLAICMAVGLFVAAMGLFGLSAFLAEQRTKEIGVRKALGASRAQVLRRLLVQFAWPVILANLITCPVFYAFLAYVQRAQAVSTRFIPDPGVFAIVIAGSMLIAFVAVFSHAWQVSGQRPVRALRYE